MNGDLGLLPHRTGIHSQELEQDEIASITRASLVKVSIASLGDVLDSLLTLLEELARPYRTFANHPPHVVRSEVYILSLTADCCAAHWLALQKSPSHGVPSSYANSLFAAGSTLPSPLERNVVIRAFDYCKALLKPITEGCMLPARALLEDDFAREILEADFVEPLPRVGSPTGSDELRDLIGSRDGDADLNDVEPYIRQILEFLSTSNFDDIFEYVKSVVGNIRNNAPSQASTVQTQSMVEDEKAGIAALRFTEYACVDSQKLARILQDVASNFLYMRRSHQSLMAYIASLMIIRWIERRPEEFVRLHNQHRKLDGASTDTLFDMTMTVLDSSRKRGLLYPFQTGLLMLLPDVFEVASNLRDAKSSGLAKKVAFLEGLRKALRSRNESAGYSLVMLLRAARHFDDDSDAAMISYVMDVQDDIRDAVFRRNHSNGDKTLFDQGLTTTTFIGLTELSVDGYVDSVVQTCLHPSAPQIYKTAVFQACSYFARLPNADHYSRLFAEVAPFVREQIQVMSAVSTDLFLRDRTTTHRKNSETTVATNAVICNILKFLQASPTSLFASPPPDTKDLRAFCSEIYESFLCFMVTANDTVRALGLPVAESILSPTGPLATVRQAGPLSSESFRYKFWRLISLVVIDMLDKYTQYRETAIIKSIHAYFEACILLLEPSPELNNLVEDVPERLMVYTKTETTLLMSLCSPEIETCQMVTSCLGIFNEQALVLARTSAPKVASNVNTLNSDVYSEISSRGFRFTGMMAFQKRTRALLRRLQHPTPGIVEAWELSFDKWHHLSKDVSSAEYDEEPLLNRYLRLSTQLLACSNVRVRETMRDVLSTEISSTLYQPLFKALESELEVLFTGALEASGKGQDREIVFAEQAASLLKTLVERLETPSELGAASSVDFSSLGLSFAKFLDGIPENLASLRVKTKICQLCESVTKKKEHLNLRDDVRKRNQLLEYIFSWIARPNSPRSDGLLGRQDEAEAARLQKDLDKACLQCLAGLTYRLPLQPGEGQSDASTSELKSQMFHTYFNRFLSLLNYESEITRGDNLTPSFSRDEIGSTSDLAITILSNLLSANIDVGLKHSLSIGYHENVEIRTAFVKVLYNILVQGTEFSNLSDKAVNEKYDELLQLLTKDLNLAVALSSVCPSNEAEELTISLLNIFESRGLTFDLMEALIKQEIEETDNEAEILRRNCVATKLLSIYAKWKGANYLKATLQKVVERLLLTSKDLDLELDPSRISSQEQLKKNATQLKIVAKVFIDDICASTVNIPPSFRMICHIISNAVMPRFQEAKYTAVGAFVFLRFFCPAIVAPEAERLVDVAPSKEMRRGLLLIAKVIQNLANNVLFGAKEPYMYPLNDFLTQNIYRVTTFLREISVPPETLDPPTTEVEAFDFGSCVALHRFLYDHWDHVRQRLVSQERREHVRSPNEVTQGRAPILEPLRALVANLGPPPLAVTWNRPQISTNTPVAYSRFQHFMLRNAFRSTDSFMTSRAIYDGGESKDGLSIICVILRHIDQDSIDYDTLLYCYLKIASCLWHKPFGLLIDATCYNGQNEPQDELFRKLELLSPSELSKQLSRVYVYNMNSTYRKCFRRMLRVASKNDLSVFNPGNVDFHMLGSLQDLQAHFHLSQLHLPRETISVVTDTRYVFQPITRLSKTKGKIEVVIKVGSQFVQVTTVRKQDVHPSFRLSAVVNDIFRLGDVDEAPTSIPTEDDSAFGLRADNGKIVMYFQSPKKTDVLQAIRSARAKYGKDGRVLKSFERLIRPQDVPGTLLNLALTNLSAPDSVLRISSYNLLGALCRAFNFKAASKFMCIKDVSIPLDPTQFIVNMSKTLAQEEPQLTADFLNEFFVGWESFSDDQKPLSLAYMAPWLPGLRTSLLGEEADGDKGKEKIASIFRKLIDVTVTDPSLSLILEHTVWPAIYKDETLLDIFLEEVIKAALALGMDDEQTQALTSIVTAMGTITLRGKIISRLRKALNRSSLRPTKYLPDNAVWPEVCILLQFCLSLSFDCGVQSQLYLPEIFHIVTMLANMGPYDIRSLVHRLLINSIHAACTSFKLDDNKLTKLRGVLELIAEPRSEMFSIPSIITRDGVSIATVQDAGLGLSATESLAGLLFETCSIAAPSVDMANAWRSRWMSLVASTAFQNNPAIQPRAFTVMGCLAREEVDDDLLYQVLVALRNSVARFGDDSNSGMLVAVVTSLSKMISKLTTASRYGLQLFWLAVSLIRLVPTTTLFNCATLFLDSVLTNIGASGELKSDNMAHFLLMGRAQLEEATLPLDEVYGVHFTPENFHYAICACLVRGLTDPLTRTSALRALSTFLQMTTESALSKSTRDLSEEFRASPYLALIQARAATPEDVKDCLWSAGVNPVSVANLSPTRTLRDRQSVKDKDLLLNTAIELVDFQNLEDPLQTHTLEWLSELACERPTVVLYLCPTIGNLLDEILLHAQSSATLKAAHVLLDTLHSNARFSAAIDGPGTLMTTLEDMGFEGLWRSCSFIQTQEHDRQLYLLTEKLIELIII
ncbi:GTPase [Xylariomycetidae sp. FL0641]|nr:GTPase [Xylariomycetidae sp. FL0641]